MKKIFNNYVQKVCVYYGLSERELFSSSSKSLIADGRYLLYFLCARADISNATIKTFMEQEGFKLYRSSVTRGIQRWQDKVTYDEDLLNDVLDIEG